MGNGVKNLWNFIRQQDSAIVILTKYAGMQVCRYAGMEQRQRAKVKNHPSSLFCFAEASYAETSYDGQERQNYGIRRGGWT